MLPPATQQIMDVFLRFRDTSEKLITFLVPHFFWYPDNNIDKKKMNINIVSFPTAALNLTGCGCRLLLSHYQISICKNVPSAGSSRNRKHIDTTALRCPSILPVEFYRARIERREKSLPKAATGQSRLWKDTDSIVS